MAELPDRDELLARLDRASRKGSVQATKLLLEELKRADDDEPGSTLDALDGGNVTPIRRAS